jgi:hypothetical protein
MLLLSTSASHQPTCHNYLAIRALPNSNAAAPLPVLQDAHAHATAAAAVAAAAAWGSQQVPHFLVVDFQKLRSHNKAPVVTCILDDIKQLPAAGQHTSRRQQRPTTDEIRASVHVQASCALLLLLLLMLCSNMPWCAVQAQPLVACAVAAMQHPTVT